MSIVSSNQYTFGTELRLAATSLTGSAVLIGALQETPAMITFNNDTDQTVFISDNVGSTKGITLIAGKCIVFDCVTNRGNQAQYGSWRRGTQFFATGPVGTGAVRIGLVSAE